MKVLNIILHSLLVVVAASSVTYGPHALARTRAGLTQLRAKASLQNYAQAASEQGNELPGTVLFLSTIVSDEVIDDLEKDAFDPILFREDEVDQAMDTLVRKQGRYPIVIGETGAGKSAVARLFIEKVLTEDYPSSNLYRKEFDKAVVLRVSGRSFMPGGADLAAYIDTVKFMAKGIRRPIIVMMEECQFLNDFNVSVLRGEMNSPNPLPIWLETDSKSYGNTIKGHPSFVSIAQPILIREPRPDQVKEILKSEEERIQQRMSVDNPDEVLAAVVDVSGDYRRDIAEPRRSLTLLEDFSISQHRAHPSETVVSTKVDLYRYVAKQAGLPVLPQDEQAFAQFMNGVRERVSAKVIGQGHMVGGVIDQFKAALTSRTRQHSVALMLGPTGVGKSYLPEVLAQEFYGDKSRYLELDMTQFADSHATTTLFGASNGYMSADKEKGILCDFFDGPGRGGGILVLNEIEEMSGEVFTRFMEIFDKGVFRGGDNKERYLGKTLVVLTSNKNSDKIMPYDAIQSMTKADRDRRLSLITQEQLKKAFTEKTSYSEADSKVVKSAVLERVDRLYFASPLLADEGVAVSQLEIAKFVKQYNTQGSAKLDVDPSVAQVITSAFYNPALGSRQIRTAVQRYLSLVIQDFKAKYGYDNAEIKISATNHPARATVSYLTATNPANGDSLTIDGPSVPVTNKMMDPAFRERLAKLEESLKSEIFGQDEAISAVVSAIKSRFMRGGKEDIASGFLAGQTGSGKSQIAKSLSKFLFDRPDAFQIFDMGRINNMHDLANIFSPPKGIEGGDQPGELERFLLSNPDGVLLFDEASNAGGGNQAVKEAIAKQFYTMIQEGYYRTPSGKVYDLSNYVIIFTGNDGEDIFRGFTSDSLLEARYNEATKSPGLVDDMLRKAGFSEAFIGRLGFTVLMRPTLGPVKVMIARKLLNDWRKQLQSNQPFDITYDDEFVQQVGELMYSPRSGARSINKFIGRVLGKAIGDEALKFNWENMLETGTRAQISLKLKVIKPSVPFYSGDEPDKKEAVLLTEAVQNGSVVSTSEVDFTKFASFMPQVHIDSARFVAYHEMGHAITAFTGVTGKKLAKVTIIPENIGGDLPAYGYAQYNQSQTKSLPGHEYLIKMLAGLLAGSEAEILLGGPRNTGRGNDVDKAGAFARAIILENHLVPELDSAKAYVDKDGHIVNNLPEDKKRIFDRYVDQALAEGRALAIQTLRQNWHVIEAGVEILMSKGDITGEEFQELVAAGRQVHAEAGWWKKLMIKWGRSIKPASSLKIDTAAVLQKVKDCASKLEAN